MARRKRDIYNQVITELGDPITIQVAAVPGGKLGCCEEHTSTITIDPAQPPAGRAAVLLHELMHLVDAQLVRQGIRRRRADHPWIESFAPNLLIVLVAAGIWPGLTLEDVAELWPEDAPAAAAREP